MKDNKVENVKLLGTRDMNMDSKAKAIFNEIDYRTAGIINSLNPYNKMTFQSQSFQRRAFYDNLPKLIIN